VTQAGLKSKTGLEPKVLQCNKENALA